MSALIVLASLYVVSVAVAVVGSSRIAHVGDVGASWTKRTVGLVLFVEMVTLALWVWALESAGWSVAWVITMACVAQALMLAWVFALCFVGSGAKRAATLVIITIIAMGPFIAVGVGATLHSKMAPENLVMVWLHTGHRVLVDGVWCVAVWRDYWSTTTGRALI